MLVIKRSLDKLPSEDALYAKTAHGGICGALQIYKIETIVERVDPI